jgi:hypothetical protein
MRELLGCQIRVLIEKFVPCRLGSTDEGSFGSVLRCPDETLLGQLACGRRGFGAYDLAKSCLCKVACDAPCCPYCPHGGCHGLGTCRCGLGEKPCFRCQCFRSGSYKLGEGLGSLCSSFDAHFGCTTSCGFPCHNLGRCSSPCCDVGCDGQDC